MPSNFITMDYYGRVQFTCSYLPKFILSLGVGDKVSVQTYYTK